MGLLLLKISRLHSKATHHSILINQIIGNNPPLAGTLNY